MSLSFAVKIKSALFVTVLTEAGELPPLIEEVTKHRYVTVK